MKNENGGIFYGRDSSEGGIKFSELKVGQEVLLSSYVTNVNGVEFSYIGQDPSGKFKFRVMKVPENSGGQSTSQKVQTQEPAVGSREWLDNLKREIANETNQGSVEPSRKESNTAIAGDNEIYHSDYVGGKLFLNGIVYRMKKPIQQDSTGKYLYEKVS